MKHFKKFFIFFILFMVLVPISFASDNVTLKDDQLALIDNNDVLTSSNI